MTLDSQALERIERCRQHALKWLPSIRQLGPVAQEQVDHTETTLWLCSVVATVLKPVTNADSELLALRTVLLECARILGGSKALGDAMVRLAKQGRIPAANRVMAELFLADLARLFEELGFRGVFDSLKPEPGSAAAAQGAREASGG